MSFTDSDPGNGGLRAVTVSSPEAIQALCEEILDRGRTYAIVGLTSRPHEQHPALSAAQVREIAGRNVPIYIIPTGRGTVTLKRCLPERLNVFGGAARVWWPHVSADSHPAEHPLIYDPDGVYGPRSMHALARCLRAGPPVAAERDHEARTVSDEQLATELAALAHPIALRIMRAACARADPTYGAVEVSRALEQPLTLVHHHLRILDQAGLAEVEPIRRRGFTEHRYSPTARGGQLVSLLTTVDGVNAERRGDPAQGAS